MNWIASLALTLVALRHAAATNSTMCTPRFMSYLINANASISTVEPVSAGGGFGLEGNIAFPGNVTNLPSLCAVTFNVKEQEGNQTYSFGLFLPDEWNDKILTVGYKGYSGGLNLPAMAAGVKYGYVTLTTDAGHNSTYDDLTWALNDEEARQVFGHRALHGSLSLAQRVIDRYYGLGAQKSYFIGGRQGLKAAELYPRDFQAMLIGAPGWSQGRGQSWHVDRGALNQPVDGPNHLGAPEFATLARAVMEQCDKVDGIEDSIITTPNNCTIDWTLITCSCPGANQTSCLTAEQVATAKEVYADYEVDGWKVFSGLNAGSESEWGATLGNGSDLDPTSMGYMRNFLFNDPEWNYTSYNDSIPAWANEANPGNVDITDFNFTAYKTLGHKILWYTGMADGGLPTRASTDFFEYVVNATDGGDVAATKEWFRLFLVPGLGHQKVTTPAAPWFLGGWTQWETLVAPNATVENFNNPTHDMLAALDQWEGGGAAPESIIATTWNTWNDPSSGVLRQRPICAYPVEQKYNGGNETLPESFSC